MRQISTTGRRRCTPRTCSSVRIGDPTPIPHPIYGSSGWMLFFTNTDWRKAVFENGFERKHTLTASGGGQNSSYYLSGTYSDLDGVIRYANDNNRRYNLRLNYDYDFSRRIRLESKLSLENQDRSDIGGLSHGAWCSCPWLVVEAIFGMPNHPVYTRSGQHFFAQGGWGNAVAQAKEAATATFAARGVNTNFKLIVEPRSEEHTSELQSRLHLVCRLLLEKKKTEQTKRSKSCR